jgi:hypothetical protein
VTQLSPFDCAGLYWPPKLSTSAGLTKPPILSAATIEQLTTQLLALPRAKEGVTEDVHQTVNLWSSRAFPLAQNLSGLGK